MLGTVRAAVRPLQTPTHPCVRQQHQPLPWSRLLWEQPRASSEWSEQTTPGCAPANRVTPPPPPLSLGPRARPPGEVTALQSQSRRFLELQVRILPLEGK